MADETQVDAAIAARRAFIGRFTELCAADERVAALFLSGSYAAGTPDRFSDVDLVVVTAEDAYESLFADRWKLMRECGELVLAEDFDGFGRDMLLYLYADGVDGEVDLHRREQVSWADPSALVPLVDKDGVAGDVRAWPEAEVEDRRRRIAWLLGRFWRYVWLGSGSLARGRLLTAHHYVEAARVACVNLARLGHDPTSPWSFAGYDKAEHVLSPAEQAALAASFVPLEPRALAAAFAVLIGFFEPLARELCERHSLELPADLGAVARRRLDEVRGRT